MVERRTFKSVWISDLHLGSAGANAACAASFLKHIEPETLYLVGDIVDMWRLQQRWYWPPEHSRVIRRILKMAENGVRVIFVPGNHDEAARPYEGLQFGGVEIMNEVVHETVDGRQLLITHGDLYDRVASGSPMLNRIGSAAYDSLVRINRIYNSYRARRGKRPVALSQAIKSKVKKVCTHISDYESSVCEDVRRRSLDGVVCGHVHKVEARKRDDELWYYNCGDWVESCTALAEDFDGNIRIVDGASFIESFRDHEPDEIDLLIDQLPIPSRFRNRQFVGQDVK